MNLQRESCKRLQVSVTGGCCAMWRLMLVTFGFLGFAFYELSGGSDYAPAANSIQARAAERAGTPIRVTSTRPALAAVPARSEADAPVPTATEAMGTATAEIGVTRAGVTADALTSVAAAEERFEITLASTGATFMPPQTAAPADAEAAATAIDAAILSAIQGIVLEPSQDDPVFSLETYAAASAQEIGVPRPTADDIRMVSGNMVNMRTGPGTEFRAVERLARGTLVAILEEPGNGWVMLEVLDTGETGWMADWLVTASN